MDKGAPDSVTRNRGPTSHQAPPRAGHFFARFGGAFSCPYQGRRLPSSSWPPSSETQISRRTILCVPSSCPRRCWRFCFRAWRRPPFPVRIYRRPSVSCRPCGPGRTPERHSTTSRRPGTRVPKGNALPSCARWINMLGARLLPTSAALVEGLKFPPLSAPTSPRPNFVTTADPPACAAPLYSQLLRSNQSNTKG